MRYLVTLKPMEPFMFGGDQTFGQLGDKEAGTYLVRSRQFPQQTALLGMIKKEIMTQAGVLTRKRRGEWVDKKKKSQALKLVGAEKFDMRSSLAQDIGSIRSLGCVFLVKENKRYIKKADIDTYPYIVDDEKNKRLDGFSAKVDIYDNFVALEGGEKLTSENIFRAVEQTGNKKGGEENSLFKKTSYLLQNGFKFAFYLDVDFELQDAMVTLGADRSSFMMQVKKDDATLEYTDKQGYMTLLSDTYITLPLKENCEFAVTSEITHRNLKGKKTATLKYKNVFEKSQVLYMYEKGSVLIRPTDRLLETIDNPNLQQIGYNIFTKGEEK